MLRRNGLGYRVLVVDDYEPWRRRVAAELEKSGRWQVVAEVQDGVDAVREARALKPDVIVLDIGLKTMNGVEAARRILADDPDARILFLTGQLSPDIAEAALATGARGYLLKPDAGGRLVLALETVASGARFVSRGLPSGILDITAQPATEPQRHDAVFHSDEAALVDDYARFAERALERGQPVIVIAPRHCLGLVQERLEARGVAIRRAIDEGRYHAFDIESELSKLIPDGRYDPERFRESAATMLRGPADAAHTLQRVAACGEIAPHLWRDGRADAAIEIEQIWDEAAKASGAELLCGYLIDGPRLADNGYSVFHQICAAHDTVHVR